MKNIWFYLKLICIGLLTPLAIYFLNELILVLSFDISISFLSFIVDNIPISNSFIVVHIWTMLTYAIASLMIFLPIYFFLDLNLKHNQKKVFMVTTITIITFTYLAPYVSEIFLSDMIIYYDLVALFTVLAINIYIIFKLSKR